MKSRIKERIRTKYIIVFAILLCIEIIIALYINDSFIRPYVGDMLVVIVLYCAVRVIIPEKYNWIPLAIFVFSTVVECLQYYNLVQLLGVQDNTLLRILIGSTFDWKDIVCYEIGCFLLVVYEWNIRRNRREVHE